MVPRFNFAIRVALTFGGVQKGDGRDWPVIWSSGPRCSCCGLGPLDVIKVGAEFAALLNGCPTITDQVIDGIPEK